MTPRQHHTNTRVLAAPPGVSIDECVPLPITDTSMNDAPAVASFWYPDERELALLNEGRGVCIVVAGQTHPPISVGVDITPSP